MSHEDGDVVDASLPTSTSSLLLPTASLSLSKTVSSLSRSALSIGNRLSSIHHDSFFVQHLAEHYKLPLVANERCGSWYIPPNNKAGSAYFKSTDGHQGQWSFSTRRLNMQVLEVVGNQGGCIIVDSTRRGKSMPDALSKTVPIWCAVMNRLLFEPDQCRDTGLFTPDAIVSPSEHSQIEARLDRFVEEAKRLHLSLSHLRQLLAKPLRPIFITPSTPLPNLSIKPSDHHLVVCLTVSSSDSSASGSIPAYIQGAADDSESWSHGLTPTLFWAHKDTLLSTSEDELPDVIHSLLETPSSQSHASEGASSPRLIHSTSSVYIAPLSSIAAYSLSFWDAVIICAPINPFGNPHQPNYINSQQESQTRILHLPCPNGKLGSRALRTHLEHVAPFIDSLLRARLALSPSQPRILCTCTTGTDLSVGAALVVLSAFADDEGRLRTVSCGDGIVVDKTYIRRRLAWVTASIPQANPSRETLQAVNVCMMKPK